MRAALAAAVLIAVAPATSAQSPAAPAYVPTDAAVARLDEAKARQVLAELARREGFKGMVVFGRELQAFVPPSWITGVEFSGDELLVRHEKGELRLRIAEIPEVAVIEDTVLGFPQYGVAVTKDDVLWPIDGGLSTEQRRADAMRLADAIAALRHLHRNGATEEAQFDKAVAYYRASVPKPAPPEAARRARVQADFAIAQKRYAAAADFYAEGLREAPWWPEGRFNRALLLAEATRYREAIAEMRRYLKLLPDAPDARVAQDRIYQWESAMQIQAPGGAKP